MVKITKATFGDEFDSTDVLGSLSSKQTKEGDIDVRVDSSLIPVVDRLSGAQTTTLSNDDKQEIKDTVAQMCGPNDQVCMEVRTQELAQAKLKQKEAVKTSSTAEVIKGRRLTVEYVDANGTKRTAVIPEGQQFQTGGLGKEPAGSTAIETKPSIASQIFSSWWGLLGTTLLTFAYAGSIIVTWMTFVKYGSKVFAAGMVAIAVIIPYSGFALSFLGPFIVEYFRIDKIQRLKAVVPEEMAAIAKGEPGLIPTAPPPLVR